MYHVSAQGVDERMINVHYYYYYYYYYYCQSDCATTVTASLSPVTEDCPQAEGYLLYRPLGLCYKYYWQSVFWDDAESICSSAGTSLIKVDSLDKFQHLYQFLRGSTGKVISFASSVSTAADLQVGLLPCC